MFNKLKYICREYNLFDKFKFGVGSFVFIKVLTTFLIKIGKNIMIEII
jgi:hypothetical protein